MHIGYFGANLGAFDNPDAIERPAPSAEQLGFESIWTGEHVILIDPQQPPSPVPPHAPFVDTIATLAFMAAKTEKIKLGSQETPAVKGSGRFAMTPKNRKGKNKPKGLAKPKA